MMNLKESVNSMIKNGNNGRNVTIQIYKSKDSIHSTYVVYKGPLFRFAEYINEHKDIEVDEENGFLHKTIDIERFSIVEILVDYSIRSEADLPDWNKSKIIRII